MHAGRKQELCSGGSKFDQHSSGFAPVFLRGHWRGDHIKAVRTEFTGSPKNGWGNRQELIGQFNAAGVIKVDVNEPSRRLAEQHTDVQGVSIEVPRQIASLQ